MLKRAVSMMSRSRRAVRRPLVRRIAWGAAGALVALGQVGLVVMARAVDRLYAADPHWFMATYAEPWRTAAVFFVVLAPLAAAVSAAFARRPPSWGRFAGTIAIMLAGLALCLELTRTVRFNDALGQVYVHTFVFRRAKVTLPRGDHGWRVRADFQGPFAWRLNGTGFHPRLLPLPYESAKLIGGLCGFDLQGDSRRLRRFRCESRVIRPFWATR